MNRETLNVFCCSSIHSITHYSRSQYGAWRRLTSMSSILRAELHSISLTVRHISRLHTRVTQSQDYENAQRNLVTAQILGLCRIYMMLLFTVFSNSHLLCCELVHKFTHTWIHWYSTTFLIETAREEDERWSFYARFLHASLASTAQMETYIYTWEGMELGWGKTLENGHLNQQSMAAGLLVVK